jgi:YD repeat-containing protein
MRRLQVSTEIISILILALTLITLIPCFADTINYQYDDLNRLIRTENTSNGTVVEYQYDAVGNLTQKTTTASGFQFQVTVRKDAQNPLQGVRTYLFSEGGSYLGMAQTTDSAGMAVFNVFQGNYKVRADYLGYPFWSNVVQVAAATSIDLTIPHHTVNITVNGVYQGISAPLSGINVYLFTPSGSYLGQNQKTDADGRVNFSLPDRDYKVRADYLGRQYFSAVFNAEDTTVNIPMAEAEITVLQAGQPVTGVNVYAFTSTGSYLGINGKTDGSGKVAFRLPVSSYKFRADYLSNVYWSAEETLTADQLKPIVIDTGGGSFSLTVLKGTSDPLIGVNCYVFSEAGSYLGRSGKTGDTGQVSYNLSNGNYKFRVDYLGYSHWTDVVTVPTTMSITKVIDHQTVTITVAGSLTGDLQAKPGIPVYLFSPSGSYLSLSGTTDGTGRVSFSLPQKAYKVRADCLGRPFWSDSFTWEDKTIVIPEGTARIHVTMAGQDLGNVSVYAFSSGGSYLGLSGTTNASGRVDFRFPAGMYKFRADYQGNPYWATAVINQDVTNTVEISTGGGAFTLTLLKGASDPLTGVNCYVFNEGGSYLGFFGATNGSGQVAFNLSNGNYKFRVDYMGYPFWTDLYTVPTTLAGTFAIPHQNSVITVAGVYQGSQPIAGVNVYLFTSSGSYLSKTQATDGDGHETFSLPNKGYKARVDYRGYSFWSGEFQFQDATVSISQGVAQIIAQKNGNPVSGVRVYLFSGSGSYLGLNATTNADGKAEFLLPNKSYKFRVDEGGTQHWSAVKTIIEGQINPVEVIWD